MTKFDWRTVELTTGVLREPTPDESRIILWMAGTRDQGYQHWERITNVPGAEIAEEQGVCFTPATSMPARQKIKGLVGKVADWLRKPAGTGTWLLPTGGFAEESGDRRNGLLLAWEAEPTDGAGGLPEAWLAGRAPRQVGANLFVVDAAPPPQGAGEIQPVLLGEPKAQAERLLADARQNGDQRAEILALTDLGIARTRMGDGQHGMAALEEALTGARGLGDRPLENDALAHLGMALLATGQAARALDVLGQALAFAREMGDRYLEKSILAGIALVLANMRNFAESLVSSDHALQLARELVDRPHEAELLWFQAIQKAELGRAEDAAKLAQSAIDIHATLRSPHVAWLAGQLRKFRPPRPTGPPATAPMMAAPKSYYTGPTAVKTPAAAPPAPAISIAPCDPGLLRAAMSAVKALENSATSGMKTVPAAIYEKRLEQCAVCPQHTGMRCRLCGSFTSAKAWLPHEKCPLGKWE